MTLQLFGGRNNVGVVQFLRPTGIRISDFLSKLTKYLPQLLGKYFPWNLLMKFSKVCPMENQNILEVYHLI